MNSHHQYVPRVIEKKLRSLFGHFPVVVVSGARQVGKSTLLEKTFSEMPRVVFDPIVDIENARNEPDLFLANRKPPLILDEIQYVPPLVSAIKRRLDKNRLPGQYLFTGSQQWGVMKLLAESLAGRAAFVDLEGFNLMEVAAVGQKQNPAKSWLDLWLRELEKPDIHSFKRLILPVGLYEQLWRGFFPETQFLPQNLIPDFYAAYQRTYVERDIRQLTDVSDLDLFGRFFRLCAALTAQEINFSQLGRELGLTPQTASRWIHLLKATFQWFDLPPYSGNTIKRISNKPKGYIGDTGMACFAQAISTPAAIPNHPLWGALFETAVVNEIRKQCRLLETEPRFYHWRSHGGAEVDLLLEYNGVFYPIEIKVKTNIQKTDLSGIESFRKTYPRLKIARGLVVAPVETPFSVSKEAFVLPWDVCVTALEA